MKRFITQIKDVKDMHESACGWSWCCCTTGLLANLDSWDAVCLKWDQWSALFTSSFTVQSLLGSRNSFSLVTHFTPSFLYSYCKLVKGRIFFPGLPYCSTGVPSECHRPVQRDLLENAVYYVNYSITSKELTNHMSNVSHVLFKLSANFTK